MTFSPELYLKWLEPSQAFLDGKEFVLVNKGVVVVEDISHKIIGLTVFEPRQLNADFVERLKQRLKRSDLAALKFSLYLPDFLKNRSKELFSNESFKNLDFRWSSFVHLQCKAQHFTLRDRMRIVNVDDSPVILKVLKHGLSQFPFFDIVTQISDSTKATEEILRLKPDAVTMDIQMPRKNGVQLVTELLQNKYFPTLMISSLSFSDGTLVFDALNAGAFDYLQKPNLDDKKEFFEELKNRLLSAAEGKRSPKFADTVKKVPNRIENISYPKNLIWCLGSSTGGTQALTRIFTSLPQKIPPTLVVQHIPPVFSKAFADSLNQLCGFTVKEAENNEIVLPNHVYIAAGGLQMGVLEVGGQLRIQLSDSPPVNRFKPSVDYLFKSIAQIKNIQLVAGILTGMGKDGAQGLLELKKIGASTLAQDEESSAVFGMPRAAIELNAAQMILPLDSWAENLLSLSLEGSTHNPSSLRRSS